MLLILLFYFLVFFFFVIYVRQWFELEDNPPFYSGNTINAFRYCFNVTVKGKIGACVWLTFHRWRPEVKHRYNTRSGMWQYGWIVWRYNCFTLMIGGFILLWEIQHQGAIDMLIMQFNNYWWICYSIILNKYNISISLLTQAEITICISRLNVWLLLSLHFFFIILFSLKLLVRWFLLILHFCVF